MLIKLGGKKSKLDILNDNQFQPTKHVCLIFTPIDMRYKDALTHFAPPLGLVALENYVRERLPDVKISILDGSVTHTLDDICDFIDMERPDVVAQSVQLISYSHALTIARHARQVGALNLLGGHHASKMYDVIANRQEDIIDFVVVDDGEEPLLGILEGRFLENIPNLVYAVNGEVYSTHHFSLDITNAPQLDYTEIDFAPYQTLLKKATFSNPHPITNYLRIYSHKGCGNRGNSAGCVFCGRADKDVRFKTPEKFWEDVRRVVELHGADYVFDVGDDFLYNSEWVIDVAASKPSFNADFEMGIFGRANRVTPEVSRALSTIGVTDIVIGFESGDAEVLRKCNKRDTTPEVNLQAAEYLFSEGIDICASFVVGLPGENYQTLQKTIKCAERIVDMAVKCLGRPPREMVANLIEPSPGSPAYHRILKMMPEKYQNEDDLSLEELQRDYFRCYFGLESHNAYQDFRCILLDAAREIHSLVAFSDSQGWLGQEDVRES